MRQKIKSKLYNIIFIIICLLLTASSLLYFYNDLNKIIFKDETELAKVLYKHKVVQRKFLDSVIWNRLSIDSLLYNGDIVRTEKNSSIIINFTNQTNIVLEEETMIQIIKKDDGSLELDLSKGNVQIDMNNSKELLSINLSNGIKLNVKQGSKIIVNTDGNESDFSIIEGETSFINQDGTESVVLSGEQIQIDEVGSINKFPLLVKNLTGEKIFIFDGESGTVDLDFNSSQIDNNQTFVFETSFSKDFNILETSSFKKNTDLIQIKNIEKDIYYRVYPEDNSENVTIGKVSVEKLYKPKLLLPAIDSTYKDTELYPDIFFKWQTDDFSDYCKIQIYDFDDTRNPVVEKEITSDSITISNLDEGKYFWKIIPHYSVNNIGYGIPSDVFNFSIVKLEKKVEPILKYPLNNSKVFIKEDKSPVLFIWESDYESDNYNLEISTDENFSNIIFSESESLTRKKIDATLELFSKGKYFWRVCRIDKDNSKYFSNVYSFNTDQYIPKSTELIYPPINFNVEFSQVNDVRFVWNLSEEIDNSKVESVLEISKEKDFSNLVKSVKTNLSDCDGVNLEIGNYYWRVRVIDKVTRENLTTTNFRNLNILDKLANPIIKNPSAKSTLLMQKDSPVKINWNKVDGADYYKVRIFNSNTKENLIKFDSVDSNEVITYLTNDQINNLNDKEYICTVQAFSDEKINSPYRISNIEKTNFKIHLIEENKLIFPANNSRIKGIDAYKTPISFSWNIDDRIKKSEFVLTKVLPNGTSILVQKILNPKKGLKIPRLSPGKYNWTINSYYSEADLLHSIPNTFTILPVEKLDNIIIRNPKNNFIFDSNYLKDNRKIIFEWEKNPIATDYLFEMFSKNEDGTLRRICKINLKENKFVYHDLSKLDIGKFEWHVTSYVHSIDGFEVQRSNVCKNEFEIKFDLPGEVKILEPGKLYGY